MCNFLKVIIYVFSKCISIHIFMIMKTQPVGRFLWLECCILSSAGSVLVAFRLLPIDMSGIKEESLEATYSR